MMKGNEIFHIFYVTLHTQQYSVRDMYEGYACIICMYVSVIACVCIPYMVCMHVCVYHTCMIS